MFDLRWIDLMALLDEADKKSDAAMKKYHEMSYEHSDIEQAKMEMYIALGVYKGLLMAYAAGVGVMEKKDEERL